MRLRVFILTGFAAVTFLSLGYAQKAFRQYVGSYYDYPLPPDYQEKTEWAFARLMYPNFRGGYGGYGGGGGYGRRRGGGGRGQSWTTDYPRADRHFVMGVRRLTRLHTRSVEQPVSLDDEDDVFNWPWLYAVEVGRWELTDAQAKKLRDYLLRGGFFMVDDFHGVEQWNIFAASMSRVFPDRPIVDLDSKDQIFHVIYDLDQRFQVPGVQYLNSGVTYEYGGVEAHWRGIYDDQGRVMVAICHNMDLGDAWEWSDEPAYPERYASLAYRIGVNYIVYAMTH